MEFASGERIPIVSVRSCLLISIQVDLHDMLLENLKSELAERLRCDRPDGVILDLSYVGIIDSFMTRTINMIGAMARLLGARTIVAGIQPYVAITLVEMGIDLEGVETVLGIDDALELVGITQGGLELDDVLDSDPAGEDEIELQGNQEPADEDAAASWDTISTWALS